MMNAISFSKTAHSTKNGHSQLNNSQRQSNPKKDSAIASFNIASIRNAMALKNKES